jgi:SET domain-containing protein
MFYYKTKLKESNHHGIGIFADEHIPAETVLWVPSPALSLHYSEDEFNTLSENEKQTISHYGYFHKEFKVWHLAADDSRYINHSKNPNVTVTEDGWGLKTLIDLKLGDEIVQDYNDFEDIDSQRKRGLLIQKT